jgi:hypothetical protein
VVVLFYLCGLLMGVLKIMGDKNRLTLGCYFIWFLGFWTLYWGCFGVLKGLLSMWKNKRSLMGYLG